MTDNVTIRLLTPSDIYPEMLESFNHKQIISNKWVKNGDRYELTKTYEVREWRRNGIGKKLFKQMCLCAEHMKADRIFISAIPSYDTISFYFNIGCLDAKYIVDSFVDTENDRYLEYNLNRD